MFRLVYTLSLLLLTYQFVVRATNPQSLLRRDEVTNYEDNSGRTLFNIIFGCLSTAIIVAWAAIHPNIPPPEGPLKRTLRRLGLMLWMIMAPEILVGWALNQRLAAMAVRDVYNNAKGYKQDGVWKTLMGWFSLNEITGAVNPAWTLRHGHFLIMGGIHLVEPLDEGESIGPAAVGHGTEQTDQDVNIEQRNTTTSSVRADTERGHEYSPDVAEGRVTILTLEMLQELVKDREFKVRLTEAEITNRSKRDVLFMMIVIFQSSWFILQSLARVNQRLSLTQLELTVLALVSLDGITFFLWWDKPLGARAILRVSLKRKLTDEERNVIGRHRSTLISDITDWFKGHWTGICDIVQCRSEGLLIHMAFDWLIRLPFKILMFLLSPVVYAFCYAIGDLLEGSTSFPADATHVPTFHVPKHKYEGNHLLISLALSTIFGGILCAGWKLPFPTQQEKKLWRIAAVAVTIMPIGSVFVVIIGIAIGGKFIPRVARIITILAILAYASARLVLLGQAFALLRDLRPVAFTAVEWTKFYPHFQ